MLSTLYIDQPGTVLQPVFMSDSAMSEYLSARPTVNSDIVLIDSKTKTIYLPTRSSRPAEGLWFIGGARKAGESAKDAARRALRRETSLDVPESELKHIATIEFLWSYRKEPPTEHGRHDINWIFVLEASAEQRELATSALDTTEYNQAAGLQPFSSVQELQAAGAREVLVDLYRTLFS